RRDHDPPEPGVASRRARRTAVNPLAFAGSISERRYLDQVDLDHTAARRTRGSDPGCHDRVTCLRRIERKTASATGRSPSLKSIAENWSRVQPTASIPSIISLMVRSADDMPCG